MGFLFFLGLLFIPYYLGRAFLPLIERGLEGSAYRKPPPGEKPGVIYAWLIGALAYCLIVWLGFLLLVAVGMSSQ